jgi:hypothetical protein
MATPSSAGELGEADGKLIGAWDSPSIDDASNYPRWQEGVGWVAWCLIHHDFRDEVDEELFTIARRNIIGREMALDPDFVLPMLR